jgi:hypothetical protein
MEHQHIKPVIDAESAARRFRARMTSGVLRPGDLATAGRWSIPELCWFPAWFVTGRTATNWTGESGTVRKKALVWTPLSGQHRGDVEELIPGRDLPQWLTAALGRAPPPEAGGPGGESRVILEAHEDALKRARTVVMGKAATASKLMLPGPNRRKFKANTTVESITATPVWIPAWRMSVIYENRTYEGWVDGIRGVPRGEPPTSQHRVAAVFAGVGAVAFGVILAFILTSAVSSAGLAAAGRQAQEEQAVQARRHDADLAEERAAEEKRHAEVPRVVAAALAKLTQADAYLAKGDIVVSEALLVEIASDVEPFKTFPELAELGTDCADRTNHISVLNAWKDAQGSIHSNDLDSAEASLEQAKTSLDAVSPAYAPRVDRLRGQVETAYKQVAPKAEKQRQKAACTAGKILRDAAADAVETNGLSLGQDMRVRATADCGTTLSITYVFCGRPFIYQLQQKSDDLRAAGFTKVWCTDGFTGDSAWGDL